MDMVEVVAKAIGDVFTAEHDRIVGEVMSAPNGAATTATVDDVLVLCARAAIEAMRDPTEAMVEAGDQYGTDAPGGTWRVMCAAALKP